MRPSGKKARHIFLFALVFPFASLHADADGLSNLQAIAAMPRGTESVMALRYDLLSSEESVFRTDFTWMIENLGVAGAPADRKKPESIILRAVAAATPLLYVEGGSQFTAAYGVGTGNYNGRTVWVTAKPLSGLTRRLIDRKDVDGDIRPFKLGDAQAFEFPIQLRTSTKEELVPETRFVAFPNDRTVLICESRDDLEVMLKGLAEKEPRMPQQWESVATGLDIEAPIVVLRRYDPKNNGDYYAPMNARRSHPVAVDGFALVMPAVKNLAFRLRCLTNDREGARSYYQEDDRFPTNAFVWQVGRQPDGFLADITALGQTSGQISSMIMRLHLLFGVNIFV